MSYGFANWLARIVGRLAAHDVRPDIENRQHDRQVHAERSQRRKPCQNSDEEWLLGFCHGDNYELIARR